MSIQPQALDRDAADRSTRTAPIQALANTVLKHLGDGWSWDDSAQTGVYLDFHEIFRVHLEDAGYGVVRGAAVMPSKFMPALGFELLIEDGAAAIAAEIRGPLLRKYMAVTEIAVDHVESGKAWEDETRGVFAEFTQIVGFAPDITKGVDPDLNLCAWFRRSIGDSFRLYAAPGQGPNVHIYVPTMDAMRSFVQTWALLRPPEPESHMVEEAPE